MKVTVVPAQVTTVEDRIIGNLGALQVALLLVPIFGGAGVFGFLPPLMEMAGYKYFLLVLITLLCGVLAIRIKGRIVLLWLVTLARYYFRPRLYLYDKNSSLLRDVDEWDYGEVFEAEEEIVAKDTLQSPSLGNLSLMDRALIEERMRNPNSQLAFETDKRGGLHVRITEAKS